MTANYEPYDEIVLPAQGIQTEGRKVPRFCSMARMNWMQQGIYGTAQFGAPHDFRFLADPVDGVWAGCASCLLMLSASELSLYHTAAYDSPDDAAS